MMDRKKLLFFFNGLPEFETMFQIACRLQARRRVEPVCFAPRAVLRREPRLKPLVAQSGLHIAFRPSRLLKMMPRRLLSQGDWAMTLLDPAMDFSSSRPRSLAMLDRGMPTIFLQHGVMQTELNCETDPRGLSYSARLLLIWEDLHFPDILEPETRSRVTPIGFIKPTLLAPRAPLGKLPPRRRTFLFCHAFRWVGRYGEEDIARFYRLVSEFAARHPEDLMIIRSHRGKVRKLYRQHEKRIAQLPNVICTHAYRGPLRGMSMTDAANIADMVISTASTAVLDAVYMDVPTAIYENDQPVYRNLPNIDGIDALEAFAANPRSADLAAVRAHYGDVTENTERTCTAIEQVMSRD